MWICLECGALFEDLDDSVKVEEGHAFNYGLMETFHYCHCGGDLEKACQCSECGEWFSKYDLNYDLCDKCYKEEDDYEED